MESRFGLKAAKCIRFKDKKSHFGQIKLTELIL